MSVRSLNGLAGITNVYVNSVSAREPLELLTPSNTSSTMTIKGLSDFGLANQIVKVNSTADALTYVDDYTGTAPIIITGSTISYDISGLGDATLAVGDNVFVQQGTNLKKTTFTNIKTLLGVPDITTATAFASASTGIITLGNTQGTAVSSSLELYGTSFSLKNTSNVTVATFTPVSNTCDLDLNGGLLKKFTASTNAVWNGGVIDEIYGGTGLSSYTTGDLIYCSATNTLSKRAIGTNNQFLIVSKGVPTWSAIPSSIYTTITVPKTTDFLLLKDDNTETYEKTTITNFINQFQEQINYGGLAPIVKDTGNVYYKFDMFGLTNVSSIGNIATFFVSENGFNATYRKITFLNLQTSLITNGILTDNLNFGTEPTITGQRQFGTANRNSLLTGNSTFINGNTDLQLQVLSSNKFTINSTTTNFNTRYVVVNGDGVNIANLKLNSSASALIGFNDRPYIGRDNVNGYIYVGNSTDSTDLFSTTTYAKTIDLSVGLDSTGDFNIKSQGERRIKITGSGGREILMGYRANSTATAEVALHICNNSLASSFKDQRIRVESRTNSYPAVLELLTNSANDSSTRYANYVFTDYQGSILINPSSSNIHKRFRVNTLDFTTNRNAYITNLGTYGIEYHNSSDYFSTSTKSWRSQVPSSTGNLTFDYRTSYNNSWDGKGYVDNSVSGYTRMNFTGQHRCIPQNEDLYNNVEDYIGMVVESTGEYNSIMFEEVEEDIILTENIDREVNIENDELIREAYVKETPSTQKHINNLTTDEATINEAQPIVQLTTTAKSKKVYGVISNREDDQDGKRVYGDGAFVSIVSDLNDNRLYINSIGEGGIKVCNQNGNIENGDLLCSSDIPGIAMKQTEEYVANYTIGKATQDYNFIDSSERKLIGCVYYCG